VSFRLWYQFSLGAEVLVVSGRPGPRFQKLGKKHLDDQSLWAELGRLGGTDMRFVDSAELRDLVLPRLRADYRLIESYVPTRGRTVPSPIIALVGNDDPEVTPEQIDAWNEATIGDFASTVL